MVIGASSAPSVISTTDEVSTSAEASWAFAALTSGEIAVVPGSDGPSAKYPPTAITNAAPISA